MLRKRRWNPQDNGLLFQQMSEVDGSREDLFLRTLNLRRRNAEDVGTACREVRDFSVIDVEARYLESSLGKSERGNPT